MYLLWLDQPTPFMNTLHPNKMASLFAGNHPLGRALVLPLSHQLPPVRRDDLRSRGVRGSQYAKSALVQKYAPEVDKRCPSGSQSPTEGDPPAALSHRPHLKPTNDSWRVDETYIKAECRRRNDSPAEPPCQG